MESGSAPDSAAGNKEQVPADLGQGTDWFVVPIPAPPGSEGNVPSDGPSALISPGGDDGGLSAGVSQLCFCRTSLDMLTISSCKAFVSGFGRDYSILVEVVKSRCGISGWMDRWIDKWMNEARVFFLP